MKTEEDARRLIVEATREQRDAGKWTLPINAELAVALSIVVNLQLALRHPASTGPSAEIAREVITGIISRMREAGFHATATLAELGDNGMATQ